VSRSCAMKDICTKSIRVEGVSDGDKTVLRRHIWSNSLIIMCERRVTLHAAAEGEHV
jgi:hypothetical protein